MPLKIEKVDNHSTITNIFIDDDQLFVDTDMKVEGKSYLQDLIQRTNFPEVGTIINVPENNVAQTTQRDPSPNLRYEDVIFPDSDTESEVDQMSDAETIGYMSDIDITDERPLHSREWLKRKCKQKNNDIKFL